MSFRMARLKSIDRNLSPKFQNFSPGNIDWSRNSADHSYSKPDNHLQGINIFNIILLLKGSSFLGISRRNISILVFHLKDFKWSKRHARLTFVKRSSFQKYLAVVLSLYWCKIFNKIELHFRIEFIKNWLIESEGIPPAIFTHVGSNQFVQEVHHPKQWRHRPVQAFELTLLFCIAYRTTQIIPYNLTSINLVETHVFDSYSLIHFSNIN